MTIDNTRARPGRKERYRIHQLSGGIEHPRFRFRGNCRITAPRLHPHRIRAGGSAIRQIEEDNRDD